MFTGIVLERGRVTETPRPSEKGGVRLVLDLSAELLERLTQGASLAVDGVCLTVTERRDDPPRVVVELSPETLRRTRLGDLGAGDEVNLEPALRAGDPMGGHWVQGHVDGVVRVLERRDLDEHRELAFELPPELEAYLVEKGSVSLDGVSLTVSARAPGRFEVALIPHTLEVTTLGRLGPGDRVHLEVDILAKYVEQALAARGPVR
jgi:riboflavin synthase